MRVVSHLPFVGTRESALVADTFMSKAAGLTFLAWSLLFPMLIAYLNTARAHHRLRATIGDLQQALSEVKTLRGLLPMCASCRRIRHTDDSWSPVETYLHVHAGVDLTTACVPSACESCTRSSPTRF